MKKFNVLLVEDNPGDVLLTSEALQESKYLIQMEVVYNGKEGVDYLFKSGKYADKPTPDVVLLDINLPSKTVMKSSVTSSPMTPLGIFL